MRRRLRAFLSNRSVRSAAPGSAGRILAAALLSSLLLAAPAVAEELPPASLAVAVGAKGAVVRLDGTITPSVAARFAAILDRLPPGKPLLLELSSPGGYTAAGYAMIDRLEAERAAGRPLATYVRAGRSCESMCVGLFMAGNERLADAAAEFMVHAPRGLRSGTVTVRSTGRMIQRLVGLGVSQSWIEQVKAAGGFSGLADYRSTAKQLAADGANVVTALLP